MFTPTQLKVIVDHARKHAADNYPFECCGLVDASGTPYRCINIAKDREREFRINETEAAKITRKGKIAGVYHSHINERAYLSKRDREGFASGLHVVVSVRHGAVRDVQAWYLDGIQEVRIAL